MGRLSHICNTCKREGMGSLALIPPHWKWHGSVLLCGDCDSFSQRVPSGRTEGCLAGGAGCPPISSQSHLPDKRPTWGEGPIRGVLGEGPPSGALYECVAILQGPERLIVSGCGQSFSFTVAAARSFAGALQSGLSFFAALPRDEDGE